ncbi:hypothetical protein [Sedimentitalea sp.]|uniref:hypothetical protein n=1 Tax=Sedimentitalea sp. TaxID=2048915 RepID=UPI003299D0CE
MNPAREYTVLGCRRCGRTTLDFRVSDNGCLCRSCADRTNAKIWLPVHVMTGQPADKRWFRRHPRHKYRLRYPKPFEIDFLAQRRMAICDDGLIACHVSGARFVVPPDTDLAEFFAEPPRRMALPVAESLAMLVATGGLDTTLTQYKTPSR